MSSLPTLLVTGGAGFIGSAFVGARIAEGYPVVVLDALTYAGHRENLDYIEDQDKLTFIEGDIRDGEGVLELLHAHQVKLLFHFAAESHVDNSITGPGAFIDTNINGTYSLLEAARRYLTETLDDGFRFVYVSTDEVYGSLGEEGAFTEASPLAPNSPYSASKAAGDLLVRAWHHTYGLPTITTHCTNNYGPRQHPEKLIPHMITCALAGKPLPVYGDGQNVRDWIYVEDHARGVWLAGTKGAPGEAYDFGGRAEMTNLELVELLCRHLDALHPKTDETSYKAQISFVKDRPGHDRRYAIDDTKTRDALHYNPSLSFNHGLKQTVEWYLDNGDWCETVLKKQAESQGLP